MNLVAHVPQRESHGEGFAALRVEYAKGVAVDVDAPAGHEVLDLAVEPERAALELNGPRLLEYGRQGVFLPEVAHFHALDLLGANAQELAPGLVDVEQLPAQRGHGHEIAAVFDEPHEFLPFPFDALALGDIAHNAREHAPAAALNLAHREIEREDRAILAFAGHLAPDADNLAHPGLAIVPQVGVVLGVVRLGHQYLDVLPD